MGKHEAPPFRMVIEGGRMVPATAYDQERLESYRRGTKVNVRLTEEKDRVLVRKWWAIIGKAVKECATPWKTRDEASEAIKLSLGIVNLSKTVAGDWMQYPKSLTELTDPELVEAVEGMAAIIQRITGVDPDDWKKEIAHVGEDEPSEADAPADDGGSGDGDASTNSAADLSDAGNGVDEGAEDIEAREEPGASSAPEPNADKALLVRVYLVMQDCVGPSVEDFNHAFKIFDADLAEASDTVKRKAETIRVSLEFCCGDNPKRTKLQARSYLAGVIGVDEAELG